MCCLQVEIYKKIGFEYKGEKSVSTPWNEWRLWYFIKHPGGAEEAA